MVLYSLRNKKDETEQEFSYRIRKEFEEADLSLIDTGITPTEINKDAPLEVIEA